MLLWFAPFYRCLRKENDMQNARMLGNYVQKVADSKKCSPTDVGHIIGCTEHQVLTFYKGRSFLSFSQMSRLADVFEMSVGDLLKGDEEHYNATVVDCMGEFDDVMNREKILDIIDNYVDLLDSVKCAEQ